MSEIFAKINGVNPNQFKQLASFEDDIKDTEEVNYDLVDHTVGNNIDEADAGIFAQKANDDFKFFEDEFDKDNDGGFDTEG